MAAPLREKAEAFSVRGSGPQGLRRPRFSFFRFTCQTSRSLATPSPVTPEPPKPAHPTWPRGWPDDSPYENSEGLRGRVIAPRRRRVQRPYIGFGSRHCQPPTSQNTYFDSTTQVRRPLCTAHETDGPSASQTLQIRPSNPGLAPHCGHIPPPFLRNSRRGMRNAWGSATTHNALISTVQSP